MSTVLPQCRCVFIIQHTELWEAGSCRHAFSIKFWVRNQAHLAQRRLLPAYPTQPSSFDLKSFCLTHSAFLSLFFPWSFSAPGWPQNSAGCSTVPTSPCWPVCRGGKTLHPSTRCVSARPWSHRKPSGENVS